MALSLKHAFVSPKADGGDSTLVQPSNWNAEHELTLDAGFLVGRTTAGPGAAEQISTGSNLTLSGGVLSLSPTPTVTSLTLTSMTYGGVAITTTGAQLNYLSGVTSGVQAQLDAKAPIATPTFTGVASFDRVAADTGNADTAASPGYTWSTDLNTGLFLAAADELAMSTGGSERLRLNSSGALGIAGANYGTAGQALISNGSAAAPSWGTAGGSAFLASVDLAGEATKDFELPAGFDFYEIMLANVIPGTDDTTLWLRTSADGGLSFDAGATDYTYSSGGAAASAAQYPITASTVGNAAGEDGVSAIVRIIAPHLAKKTHIHATSSYQGSAGGLAIAGYRGYRASSAVVTHVRFLFSSGTLATGTITIWGKTNA